MDVKGYGPQINNKSNTLTPEARDSRVIENYIAIALRHAKDTTKHIPENTVN